MTAVVAIPVWLALLVALTTSAAVLDQVLANATVRRYTTEITPLVRLH